MDKKKFIGIVILFIILMVGMVMANDVVVKNGDSHNFVVTCMNNGSLCSPVTTGNVTIINPDGNVLVDNLAMTNIGSTFNYTLNSTQTSTNGDYLFIPMFNDNGTKFYNSLTFYVTPSGTEPDLTQGLMYLVMVGVCILLFGLCLYYSINVNGSNTYDLTGKLLKVNYGKYLKVFLFNIAFVLLGGVLFFVHEISLNFLWLSFSTGIVEVLMQIVWILVLIIFVFSLVFMTLRWILDTEIDKLATRGLKPR